VVQILTCQSMPRSDRFATEVAPGILVASRTLLLWLKILGGEHLEIVRKRRGGEASMARG
jgi:hypothetical protein